MGNNKILVSGLAGGIVSFLAGYLIWGLALQGFALENAGSATGVPKEAMDFWAIILGAMASGFLVAIIFSRWAGIKTVKSGAMAGALIGLLLGINFNFIMFGSTNITTLPLAIVDALGYCLLYTLIGSTVGFVLSKMVPAKAEEAMA